MPAQAFKQANQQAAAFGPRGAPLSLFSQWERHPDLVKMRGRVYSPKEPVVVERYGANYLNTWLMPEHPKVKGEPRVFLDHVDRVLPDEAAIFLDWLAFKVQHPELRSYAIVMVAEKFGIGRSIIGKILQRVNP